ncbi:DUF4049 domain-containing protein [Escherichia albertii]|uniref:DUF4049 domain-containing protein n=1 Tax=Escherichia albertii TaxID=208962 RepID=UPI001230542D|nr:DUF4049 domain-containing protein [Escherichia albertii]
MKVFKMISRTINSNHEDKHSKSKKVNYDQYNENVDKKKISTTVEIKMLDNIFDMGGDLGLHILYFLQNGGWNGHDAYHNTVKAWFYSSEPTVDLQEYNNFRQMINDKFIFTISPDNRNVLKTMPPITFKIKSKGNFYLLNISVDNTEIIYKMKEPFINIQNFFTLLSGNFKPDWSWTVSTDPLTDRDFDSAIASAFSWRKYFTQCGAINRKSANTAYFGDTDGCVGAVLYALLVSGHIGIQERGWGLLKELLFQEEYALRSCNNNSMVSHYKFLDVRDAILNNLHQYIFLKSDAITPCIFLGDHTGDRCSTIFGDQYILTLLSAMRDVKDNQYERINKNIIFLAGNHDTTVNGNYNARKESCIISAGDTYSLVKTLDVCHFDPVSRVLTSHHGITRSDNNECYYLGALVVDFTEMVNRNDPAELSDIFNKKHQEIMNNETFHECRNNVLRIQHKFSFYFSNTVNVRPEIENITNCASVLRCKQKFGHNGIGVNKDQIEDTESMGLNSRKCMEGSSGINMGMSCYQCS